VLGPEADLAWLSADQRAELNVEWARIGPGLVLDAGSIRAVAA
jgi:hypothetical protein